MAFCVSRWSTVFQTLIPTKYDQWKQRSEDFEHNRKLELERQEVQQKEIFDHQIKLFSECVQNRIDTVVGPFASCDMYIDIDQKTAIKCLKEKLTSNGFSNDEKLFEFKCVGFHQYPQCSVRFKLAPLKQ